MANESEGTMWYLIYCEEDDSHSVVDHDAVINANCVKENDIVTFFYGSKSYIGKVVMCNGCKKKEAGAIAMGKQILDEGENLFMNDLSGNETSDIESENDYFDEQSRKKEKKEKRQRLLTKIRQSQKYCDEKISDIETALPIHTIDKIKGKVSSSPTKEDLIKKVLKLEAQLNLFSDDSSKKEKLISSCTQEKELVTIGSDIQNSTSNLVKPFSVSNLGEGYLSSSSSGHEDTLQRDRELSISNVKIDIQNNSKVIVVDDKKEIDETNNRNKITDMNTDNNNKLNSEQLFGKNYSGEQMVLLTNDIYCKKSVLDNALKQALKPSHLVRRLISGVYTEKAIVSSTLTGQKPRAAGKKNYEGDVPGLDSEGIDAILSFIKKVGKIRKWGSHDPDKLKAALSQRIGEITRAFKKRKADEQ